MKRSVLAVAAAMAISPASALGAFSSPSSAGRSSFSAPSSRPSVSSSRPSSSGIKSSGSSAKPSASSKPAPKPSASTSRPSLSSVRTGIASPGVRYGALSLARGYAYRPAYRSAIFAGYPYYITYDRYLFRCYGFTPSCYQMQGQPDNGGLDTWLIIVIAVSVCAVVAGGVLYITRD